MKYNHRKRTGENVRKIKSKYLLKKLKGCVCYIFTVFFLSLKESPYETRKNIFHFISKAFLVHKFKFDDIIKCLGKIRITL